MTVVLLPGTYPEQRPDRVHVLSQEGQPYGSERRCCNHCGVMIWGASSPAHVDNWDDWRSQPNRCEVQNTAQGDDR